MYQQKQSKEKAKIEINALPIRAYIKIWNEFFRDQNVGNAAVNFTNDNNVNYATGTTTGEEKDATEENILNNAINGGFCLPVSRFHDYFSSCLPYPQRGPEVTIALTGNAPVKMFDDKEMTDPYFGSIYVGNELGKLEASATDPTEVGGKNVYDEGIPYKYMGADLQNIEAATINQLRQAFAVQHYYEALARGGSRYREQVRALFGVSISDKTVQVPEYLGGGRYHVNINQIVQTSGQQTESDTPIGETGAMSVTPINESSFTKSFEEHGFVIGVMCVRHNHSYQQGLSASGAAATDWTTTSRSLQI